MCILDYDVLLHRMKWWEILKARQGNDDNSRSLWSCTRLIAFVIQKTAGNDKISKPKDLFPLPWDEEPEPYTDEDMERLEQMLKQENEKGSD